MDIKEIKKLIELVNKSDLTELEYCEGEIKIKIVRNVNTQITFPFSSPAVFSNQVTPQHLSIPHEDQSKPSLDTIKSEKSKIDHFEQITSPMVGTFYRASAPEAEPFVEEESVVESNQTICIIEAMKLMNEIKAESKCKIINILIENGQPVEFGQPLFKIEKL